MEYSVKFSSIIVMMMMAFNPSMASDVYGVGVLASFLFTAIPIGFLIFFIILCCKISQLNRRRRAAANVVVINRRQNQQPQPQMINNSFLINPVGVNPYPPTQAPPAPPGFIPTNFPMPVSSQGTANCPPPPYFEQASMNKA